MKRVRFVTFPRSGHHWLITLLEGRRMDGWHYDEHHSTGNTLEKCPWITAQKTHDFKLDVPKVPEFIHVVQIRSRVPSLTSWCKLLGCTAQTLPRIAGVPHNYREAWIEKWLVSPVPNRIVVRYEELLSDPNAMVESIVRQIM